MGPSTAPARILLVDDDRLILATLGGELTARGFEVTTAASGEESVRLASEHPFDLVIMDIRMPGMSGAEAARAIRRSNSVPLLFLTALDERAIVEEAVSEGALGYLVKPVGASQLAAAVDVALARAADLENLKASEENLQTALAGKRSVSVVVGMLMERYGVSSKEAFERLRRYSRAHQRKVADVAAEVLRCAELFAEIGAFADDRQAA